MVEEKEILLSQVTDALGASQCYGERISVYIPNKGREKAEADSPQIEIEDWRGWVTKFYRLLGEINNGATTLPASSGFYITEQKARVDEKTIVVYSYVEKRTKFLEEIWQLKKLLYQFGRETRQEKVFLEFDGSAIAIREPFDLTD